MRTKRSMGDNDNDDGEFEVKLNNRKQHLGT